MGYTDYISRGDAGALIPEDTAREIIQGAVEQSAVLQLGRRLPDMASGVTRTPVLSVLPNAYFVTAVPGGGSGSGDVDKGLKQTTKQMWENQYLNAEEIACIVPIPETVLDDADYDIWGEVKPRVVEAIGGVIDRAIFWGINAPGAWPLDIYDACVAAGNVCALVDPFDAIMGQNGLIALVEEDGYFVTGHAAAVRVRAILRGLRLGAGGVPIFMTLNGGTSGQMQEATKYTLDGQPMIFPRNGAFDGATSPIITGDWTQLVYAFRQDITWKILDQAVITDEFGQIVFNLPQQDMVALRAVLRLAWQVPNPINRVNDDGATRYPFSVLTGAFGSGS
jgi:HK97 family phage major capsid protein